MASRKKRILLVAAIAFATFVGAASLAVPRVNWVGIWHDRQASQMREAGLREHTDTIGDATVHYWEGGHPSPGSHAVLLVHGFGGDAMVTWLPQATALAASRRVILADLLWFGGSSSTVADYSLGHQATVQAALLDKLGERSADVVGVSYGGLTAYQLSTMFPARVDRLVIVDSPACAYVREDFGSMLKRFGVTKPADFLMPRDEDGLARLLGMAFEDPPWTPPFALRQAVQQMYPRWHDEKAALLDALVASLPAQSGCSSAPPKPTLIVFGRNDPIFPLEIGERLARQLGDRATLKVIEKARHAPNVEHPAEFNALLEQFLASAR